MTDNKTIAVGDTVIRSLEFESLESIAESLKSIDRSLKKISGENSEKIPGPVKKSYAERYFTFKEKDDDNKTNKG